MRGSRVQAIVQELRGEKIDIIPWSDDTQTLAGNALSPAKISRIILNDSENSMTVVAPDDQLSLAIGKGGQNVRLAAKLLKWRIDIKSETEYQAEQLEKASIVLAGRSEKDALDGNGGPWPQNRRTSGREWDSQH
jgi:N utilization substance protein A